MNFKDEYTTKEKKDKDATGKEKDKTELTADAFAFGKILDELKEEINKLRFSMSK